MHNMVFTPDLPAMNDSHVSVSIVVVKVSQDGFDILIYSVIKELASVH